MMRWIQKAQLTLIQTVFLTHSYWSYYLSLVGQVGQDLTLDFSDEFLVANLQPSRKFENCFVYP